MERISKGRRLRRLRPHKEGRTDQGGPSLSFLANHHCDKWGNWSRSSDGYYRQGRSDSGQLDQFDSIVAVDPISLLSTPRSNQAQKVANNHLTRPKITCNIKVQDKILALKKWKPAANHPWRKGGYRQKKHIVKDILEGKPFRRVLYTEQDFIDMNNDPERKMPKKE